MVTVRRGMPSACGHLGRPSQGGRSGSQRQRPVITSLLNAWPSRPARPGIRVHFLICISNLATLPTVPVAITETSWRHDMGKHKTGKKNNPFIS